jgi:hypothetical protein
MNVLRLVLTVLFLIAASYSVSDASDPGLPDTVILQGGPLVLNQSVPLTLTIVNDYPVSSYSLGIVATSLDGGFATFDSAIYINRMADPSILGFRIEKEYGNDGVSPDSLLVGGLAGGTTLSLPPGNEPIMQMYYTGLVPGQMALDSAFIPPAGLFILVNPSGFTYCPEFVTTTFDIIEGNPLPIITLNKQSPQGVTGEEVTILVSGSSPDEFPIDLELVSLVGYDDESREPSGDPTFGSGNPATFSWTPAASDIGVWEATFRVTDSAGQTAQTGTDIQVVADSDYLLTFEYSESANACDASGLKHGNFDDDSEPEVFASATGFYNTNGIELYDYNGSGLTRVYELDDGWGKVGMQVGYFDDDDYLDGAVTNIIPGNNAIEIYYGDGENSFTTSSGNDYVGSSLPQNSCLGEFTGDRYLDYVNIDYGAVRSFSGASNPKFSLYASITTADTGKAVNSADFDNDGYDDLAVGTVDGIQIYLGNGAGGFSLGDFYDQVYGAVEIDVTNEGSDFDNDGNYDLCISTPSVGGAYSEMVVYLGNGDGTFDQTVIRIVKGQIFGNCVGDFNDDGELDIACVNGAREYAAILFGDGDGAFTNELRFAISHRNPCKIDGLDIDLDGDLDLVIAASGLHPSNKFFLLSNQLDPEQFSKSSLTISSCRNAEIDLISPGNRQINRIRNTMPSGQHFRRDLDQDNVIDGFTEISLVEQGAYVLSAKPKPNLSVGELFTVEFTLNGEFYRLAKDIPMNESGYQFDVYAADATDVLPRPGKFVYANPPAFAWHGEGDFDFQLASDLDFSNLLYDVTVPGIGYSIPTALEITEMTTFYWRIKPHGQESYDCLYAINIFSGWAGSCGDADDDGELSVGDAVFLINMIFKGGPEPSPLCMGDANGDLYTNVGDVVRLISFIFKGGPAPENDCCP